MRAEPRMREAYGYVRSRCAGRHLADEALALLQASAAYAVGEYRTAIDLLEGYESLSALTLLAQP